MLHTHVHTHITHTHTHTHIFTHTTRSVKSSMIQCTIAHRHITLGLKGLPPFIDVRARVCIACAL
jgi:hypothetical protein